MSAGEHDLEKASRLFRALAAPVRLSILSALDEHQDLCVHELVQHTGASQSLVSQHLRVLRDSDLVRSSRRGKEVAYSIADRHIARMVRDALDHAQEERP
jgi:DNA-binding transcriptional ArsR family regulator